MADFINNWFPVIWPVVGLFIAVTCGFFGAKNDEEGLIFVGLVGGLFWPFVLFLGIVSSPIWGSCCLGAIARDRDQARRKAHGDQKYEEALAAHKQRVAEWMEKNPKMGLPYDLRHPHIHRHQFNN